MNCYELSELLENENVINYYFNEIFYDENNNEIYLDDIKNMNDLNDDDDIFEYGIKYYDYDYELNIEILNEYVDEIKNKINEIDDEIIIIDEIQYENFIELIYRNKE